MRNSTKLMKRLLLICMFLFLSGFLFAHPHAFIRYSVEIKISNTVVTGIESSWEFDKAYSSVLIMDFDKNKDGKLSSKETADLKKKSFDGLKDYEYFTFVELDGVKLPCRSLSDFTPYIHHKKMVYRFFIPINRMVKKKMDMKINVFDPTIYIDFTIQGQPLISGSSKLKANCELVDHSKDKSFMNGETAIQEIHLIVTR